MSDDTLQGSSESTTVKQLRVKAEVTSGANAGAVGVYCGCGASCALGRGQTLPACPKGMPWGCITYADEADVLVRKFES